MKHPSRVTSRAAKYASALAVVLLTAACGGGGGGSGGSAPPPVTPPPVTPPPVTPPPVTPPPTGNRAPTAANDIVQVASAGVASINVLANDSDPDNDALTVSITTQPFVGTAAVNANGTVRIDGLPSGFRGVTRFSYQVRDPAGLAAPANAAVFVDTRPFRLAFAADEGRTGAGDLYVTDIAAPPVKIATVVQGALREVSFRASRTGSAVAYTRADPQNVATTTELYYVRTQPLGMPVRVTLPAGAALFRLGTTPQYDVSPDGEWLVLVAGAGATQTLHVLDVRSGGSAPTAVSVADAPIATRLQFSADSRFVYWLGVGASTDVRGAVWRAPLDRSGAPVRLSQATTASAGIRNFTVLETQSLVIAGREHVAGANAIVALDPASPGNERVLSAAPGTGETVDPRGITVSPDEQRFTYSTTIGGNLGTYVANVSGTPAPRLLIPHATQGGIPAEISPDNAALLYVRRPGQSVNRYYETPLDGPFAETLVAEAAEPFSLGLFAGYDGTRDRVVFERSLEVQGELNNEARVVGRSAFGAVTGTKLGAPGQFSLLRNYEAAGRGVVLLGERAPGTSGALPPVLVNTAAPDKTFPLSPGVIINVTGLSFLLLASPTP